MGGVEEDMAQNWIDFINALYIEEYDKLIRIAYHMTGNQELAEDLVQETFVLAVFHQDSLINHPKPGGWLLVTLRNLVLNERRSCSSHEVSLEDAKSILVQNEERPLDEILPLQLRSEDRKMIIMRYEDGLSYKEIADRLGLAETVCRNRVSRAIAKCRKLMQD